MVDNIFPLKDVEIKRGDFEHKLNQRSIVMWFVGLSGSGKSTIAKALKTHLFESGFMVRLLDGDTLRAGLNANLGFSDADRYENIRRTAEVAKLICESGVITIVATISPTEDIRKMAKAVVGDDLFEIFVSTSIEECERRDTKGLYAKARRGEIGSFTGISSPFEAPLDAAMSLNTEGQSVEECVDKVVKEIITKIKYR